MCDIRDTMDSDSKLRFSKSGVQRIRRLLPRLLTDFPWQVSVSRVDNKTGAFCVPCVLFAATSGVGRQAHGHGQLPKPSPNVHFTYPFFAIFISLWGSTIDTADCWIMVDYVLHCA